MEPARYEIEFRFPIGAVVQLAADLGGDDRQPRRWIVTEHRAVWHDSGCGKKYLVRSVQATAHGETLFTTEAAEIELLPFVGAAPSVRPLLRVGHVEGGPDRDDHCA